MSDTYRTDVPSGSGVASTDSDGKIDAAKHEAVELKDTATEQAKDVLGTAKHEATAVIGEATSQAKDLHINCAVINVVKCPSAREQLLARAPDA